MVEEMTLWIMQWLSWNMGKELLLLHVTWLLVSEAAKPHVHWPNWFGMWLFTPENGFHSLACNEGTLLRFLLRYMKQFEHICMEWWVQISKESNKGNWVEIKPATWSLYDIRSSSVARKTRPRASSGSCPAGSASRDVNPRQHTFLSFSLQEKITYETSNPQMMAYLIP